MGDGYILWYRKAESNPVLEDEKFDKTHAWLWLVERANFQTVKIPFNGGYKVLKRGQFHTSVRKLAKTWGWGRNRVGDFLDALEANNMISTTRDTNGATITIEKYSVYQDSRATSDATNGATNEATNRAQRNKNKENINNRGVDIPSGGCPTTQRDSRYVDLELGEPDVPRRYK